MSKTCSRWSQWSQKTMINHQTLRRVPEFFRQTHMFCFIIEFGQSPNLRSFRSPNLSCFSNAARIGRLGLCDASDALRSKRERGRSSNSRLANREPWQQTGIDIYHVYVCMYACMHAYIHTCIHTYIHYITLHYITLHYITLHYITCITCMHACMHACIHTYIHTLHTYIHTDIHTDRHTYIHPSIHACMHTYIHTCIYIYIYVCM